MVHGELLTLMLHAPLPYRGLENPPLLGLPRPEEAGRALALLGGETRTGADEGAESSADAPALRPYRIAEGPLAEGEEELFIFDEEELVLFDPEEGPRVARPLPAPRFYGRGGGRLGAGRLARGDRGSTEESVPAPSGLSTELPARELSAGRYLFMQWRPAGEEEAAEGIEWFAREAWWERAGGVGPWILRRVAEDGKLAVQILRALA